jgi:hypothetical protein
MARTRLLIHIGYHKTGTSWLKKFVFENPTIGFFCANGRHLRRSLIFPHVLNFDPSICRKHLQPVLRNAYEKHFSPVLSVERLSGSPHSGGYDSKEIADRLAQAFPQAKVLIVIREQRSIILSSYKQYVNVGGSCSLNNYLQPPARGRGRIPLFSFDHFKYHRLIEYYISLFGLPNLLVHPYELLKLNDHRLKVGGFKARLRRLKGKRLKDGGFRPRAKLPTVGLKPPIGK